MKRSILTRQKQTPYFLLRGHLQRTTLFSFFLFFVPTSLLISRQGMMGPLNPFHFSFIYLVGAFTVKQMCLVTDLKAMQVSNNWHVVLSQSTNGESPLLIVLYLGGWGCLCPAAVFAPYQYRVVQTDHPHCAMKLQAGAASFCRCVCVCGGGFQLVRAH